MNLTPPRVIKALQGNKRYVHSKKFLVAETKAPQLKRLIEVLRWAFNITCQLFSYTLTIYISLSLEWIEVECFSCFGYCESRAYSIIDSLVNFTYFNYFGYKITLLTILSQ